MDKHVRTAQLLIILLLLASALTGCAISGSPRQSLSELRTALINHDADAALRYIDVDKIVDAMVKDIFLQYESKVQDPLATLGVKAGKQVADAVMPAMKAVARQQVRAAILSDDQWGYFKDIRRSSVWYLNIEVDGDTAFVEPKGKSDVSFRMDRMGEGQWRIVEIKRKKAT
jgi:hypothetical protein